MTADSQLSPDFTCLSGRPTDPHFKNMHLTRGENLNICICTLQNISVNVETKKEVAWSFSVKLKSCERTDIGMCLQSSMLDFWKMKLFGVFCIELTIHLHNRIPSGSENNNTMFPTLMSLFQQF